MLLASASDEWGEAQRSWLGVGSNMAPLGNGPLPYNGLEKVYGLLALEPVESGGEGQNADEA
ncbi:hypothetical protein J2X36_005353 [Methylobacterium sp. BE186]|nr:hypothetical protein [Methylobacterium sp. BE186]